MKLITISKIFIASMLFSFVANSTNAQVWKKAFSCDSGALVVDDSFAKDSAGNEKRTLLRQIVIHNKNIINYFHSQGIIDITPGTHGGYYDGIPLKTLKEYPSVMIFEAIRMSDQSFNGSLNKKDQNSNLSFLYVHGHLDGDSFSLLITKNIPAQCTSDEGGFEHCENAININVASWIFHNCH